MSSSTAGPMVGAALWNMIGELLELGVSFDVAMKAMERALITIGESNEQNKQVAKLAVEFLQEQMQEAQKSVN